MQKYMSRFSLFLLTTLVFTLINMYIYKGPFLLTVAASALGNLSGQFAEWVYAHHVNRAYICHHCHSEKNKLTLREYTAWGGAHYICPELDAK